MIIPTSVKVIPAATPGGIDEAIVVFNHGKVLAPGHYNFKVMAAGIADVAGNNLDGQFYGSYPSGNTDAGSNYVGQITAFPGRTLGAFPIQSGYAKPQSVTAARTSARVEAVATPRTVRPTQASVAAASLVDHAIAHLADAKHRRRGR